MGAYSVAEAKAHFSAILDAVEQGESVIITRRGVEIASIMPTRAANGAVGGVPKKRHSPQLDFAGLRRLRESMPMSPITSVEWLRFERDERDAELLAGARK